MQIIGEAVSGSMRGKHLIEYWSDRLRGIVGFRPYKGTFNIKLENPIDLSLFKNKKILEHMNPGGTRVVECFLVPCTIFGENCWAMQQVKSEAHASYSNDVIEVLSEKNLRKKYHVKDGDKIMVSFIGE